MKAPVNGGDFEQPEKGTYAAIAYKLIDLGTQTGEYQGKATKRHQVVIGWELPEALMDDGRPFVVSKFYTLSMHEKASLRQDINSWSGGLTDEQAETFDLEDMLGKGFTLSLIENDKGKIRVGNVNGITKSAEGALPDLINPVFIFDLDDFDEAKFDSLGDFFRETIAKSPEYLEAIKSDGDKIIERIGEEPKEDFIDDGMDQDIPF